MLAAFQSPARLRLAVACLRLRDEHPSILEKVAGRYASIETLQAAQQLGLQFASKILHFAVASTDFAKVRWLCEEQGYELPQNIIDSAVEAGSMQMLLWFRQLKGRAFSEFKTRNAAGIANNLPMLQYLMDAGCQLHEDVCNSAACCKDLKQLQWLAYCKCMSCGSRCSSSIYVSINPN
jgi:hypothetical protein